jgi:hypothetical protein
MSKSKQKRFLLKYSLPIILAIHGVNYKQITKQKNKPDAVGKIFTP